jgi:hypothetical protein
VIGFASVAQGVSHKPDPVSLVVGSNIGSSQHSPSTAIPERGQVWNNSPESSVNERWRVLHEDEAGSNFANNSRHARPEPGASAVDSRSLACNADVLAREASRHHINTAAPRSSVKGANVIPNREGREKAVILSGDKYACGVGLKLDGTHGCPPEQLAAEDASTSARE